jgi:hypothetical protein
LLAKQKKRDVEFRLLSTPQKDKPFFFAKKGNRRSAGLRTPDKDSVLLSPDTYLFVRILG